MEELTSVNVLCALEGLKNYVVVSWYRIKSWIFNKLLPSLLINPLAFEIENVYKYAIFTEQSKLQEVLSSTVKAILISEYGTITGFESVEK